MSTFNVGDLVSSNANSTYLFEVKEIHEGSRELTVNTHSLALSGVLYDGVKNNQRCRMDLFTVQTPSIQIAGEI